MYCRYNFNSNCSKCTKFVKTVAVKGDEATLELIIPEQTLCNCTTICICVAQEIPAEVGKDSEVKILVGSDEYPAINQKCNFIYGDQIKAGRMYCFKFGVDTLGFIYYGGWRLCPTKHAFTCIPLPTPPAKLSATKSVTKTTTKTTSTKEVKE